MNVTTLQTFADCFEKTARTSWSEAKADPELRRDYLLGDFKENDEGRYHLGAFRGPNDGVYVGSVASKGPVNARLDLQEGAAAEAATSQHKKEMGSILGGLGAGVGLIGGGAATPRLLGGGGKAGILKAILGLVGGTAGGYGLGQLAGRSMEPPRLDEEDMANWAPSWNEVQPEE